MPVTFVNGATVATAGGAPTFTAPESKNKSDALRFTTLLSDSKQKKESSVNLSALLQDSKNKSDAFKLPTLSVAPPESKQKSDSGLFVVTYTARSRSGTPDADNWGDAWTDSTVGQTGVNHGADSALSINGSVATTKKAFIEFDLTRFTGLTATGGNQRFSLNVSTTDAVASSLTVQLYATGSRYFNESTITQSNQPAPGNLGATFTVAVPTGAATTQTFIIPDATLTACFGNWVLFIVSGAGALNTASVGSRESANPPSLIFTASR